MATSVAGPPRRPAVRERAGRRLRWPTALADPIQRRRLAGWLGIGLAVRLAVMPFAVSSDFLAVYWRSHLIAYDGTVFEGYLVNMGAHYVHAASLRLLGPLLPPPDAVWTDPWWWSDSGALAPQVMRDFSAAPDVYQTLFALKLPYLVADLVAGAALVLLLGAARPALVRRAWAFWMLSPIGIYAGYLFSRYEAFPVVFVVAALLGVERRRPWLGALALGLAITMRGYPLLLVPLFGLVAVTGLRRQLVWMATALAPFGATMVTNRLIAGTVGELARLRDAHTGTTFFAYTVPVDGDGQVYVFFLAAFALYGALAGRAFGWWGTGPVAPRELWMWLLVFHTAMFGLATFSAHYFMWVTPFVAIALARRPSWRGTLWLHLAQVVVVLAVADLLGGSVLGVFAPLAPDLATAVPNLQEALLTAPGTAEQLLGLLRTAFLALSAFFVWPALVELVRSRSDPLAAP